MNCTGVKLRKMAGILYWLKDRRLEGAKLPPLPFLEVNSTKSGTFSDSQISQNQKPEITQDASVHQELVVHQ